MTTKNKIILIVVALIIIIQLIPLDKSVPEDITTNDLFTVVDVDPQIQEILKVACYDCHSYETVYPWYSGIAPVSWLTMNHINEGREHLNFSEWGAYTAKKAAHKAEEIAEEVEEGEMPLQGYVMMHSEALLSKEDNEKLIAWAKNLEKEIKASAGIQGGEEEEHEHGEDHH